MMLLRTAFALMMMLGALQAAAQPGRPRVDLSQASVEPWARATFERAYRERRLSGLGIVAVQDGRVTYTGTFGYADAAIGKRIDPDFTRFRIGSISKSFTASAIAILLDDGKIRSLDDPANLYLKRWKLPNWQGRPIRIRDLLTHQAGLSDKEWVYGVRSLPLTREDILLHVPRQVAPPGRFSNYCNFCYGVLGFIVEDTTGRMLQDFLDERIFRPLQMSRTLLNSTELPSANVGVPYDRSGGKLERVPFEPIPVVLSPGGSVDASLDDMGRYMLSLLGSGPQYLSRAGRERLFQPLGGNDPRVSQFGMNWMLARWNGVRTIEHGGMIEAAHSYLSLFPDSNAGIFISCLCATPAGGGPAKPGGSFLINGYNLREMIYRRFLGVPEIRRSGSPTLADYAGLFRSEGREFGSRELIADLFKVPTYGRGFFTVRASGDGLMIDGKGPYIPVGRDAFASPGLNGGDAYIPYPNRDHVFFLRGGDGKVDRVTLALSLRTWVRVTGLGAPATLRNLLFAGTLLCAFGLLAGWGPRDRVAFARPLRLAAVATGIVAIAILGACVAGFWLGWLETGSLFFDALAVLAKLLPALGLVVAGALAVSLARTGGAGRDWRVVGQMVAVLLGVAIVTFVLAEVNLLG